MQNKPHSKNTINISSRAWYGASIADFLLTESNTIVGHLVSNCDFDLQQSQRNAWLSQIEYLKHHITGLVGTLFLEFNIPRMGRRIDTVLVIGPAVFVIEFKVGEKTFDRSAIDQVWDYALDLKNFHQGSHVVSIVPILIATEAVEIDQLKLSVDEDNVYRPINVNAKSFRRIIDFSLEKINGEKIDGLRWSKSSYLPTPTIVEAARSLYAQHSVDAIARFDAGAKNLSNTSHCIENIIEEAKNNSRKILCFITGVPGAGKTLVGLNVATQKRDTEKIEHAVFLSGNGPLVSVLREALTRDEVNRRKSCGQKARKSKIAESIKAFIQNVHHFRDDALIDFGPPAEHVVIFDEAQRAWNLRQTANFMRRKKNQHGFSQSEPEFLISYMDRHQDWAVIICLVGGGQEINTGEAGIDAWLAAINSNFPNWHVYISPRLTDSEYAAGDTLKLIEKRENVHFDESLHLAVSMRSFRAEYVSTFIKALLDCEKVQAREAFEKLVGRYPIVMTRDLNIAKDWIRKKARGTERYGLIASSKAQRLKPHAIDIRVNIDPVKWFLNDKDDTRSSFYLEDAATEFQVQGLELDWACVTWDGDMRFSESGWTFHDFRGTKWCNIMNSANRSYLRNAYRVLLTRARQGMIIFIPWGDTKDPTRSPAFYNSTFQYLAELGIPTI